VFDGKEQVGRRVTDGTNAGEKACTPTEFGKMVKMQEADHYRL
jgi:hypothetical protein